MRYKVGDRVIYDVIKGVVTDVNDYGNPKVKWEDGMHDFINKDYILPDYSTTPNYRALYEQEKALREAAEAIIVESGIVAETQRLKEAHKNYQQLKKQYNGQDTENAR